MSMNAQDVEFQICIDQSNDFDVHWITLEFNDPLNDKSHTQNNDHVIQIIKGQKNSCSGPLYATPQETKSGLAITHIQAKKIDIETQNHAHASFDTDKPEQGIQLKLTSNNAKEQTFVLGIKEACSATEQNCVCAQEVQNTNEHGHVTHGTTIKEVHHTNHKNVCLYLEKATK